MAALVSSTIVFQIHTEQENAMRCNNCDDLLQLSFTLKISTFSEAYIYIYIYITQSNIYDGAFIAKIVGR